MQKDDYITTDIREWMGKLRDEKGRETAVADAVDALLHALRLDNEKVGNRFQNAKTDHSAQLKKSIEDRWTKTIAASVHATDDDLIQRLLSATGTVLGPSRATAIAKANALRVPLVFTSNICPPSNRNDLAEAMFEREFEKDAVDYLRAEYDRMVGEERRRGDGSEPPTNEDDRGG